MLSVQLKRVLILTRNTSMLNCQLKLSYANQYIQLLGMYKLECGTCVCVCECTHASMRHNDILT